MEACYEYKYRFMKPVYLILLCLFFYACAKKQAVCGLETINIDPTAYEPTLDVSALIDTTHFEIIPLETNDSCLIVETTRITLTKDKIVVYDESAEGVYIFNRDGSYHAKVRAIGQGPCEYPNGVNDILVTDNYIAVFNPFADLIMMFDLDGNYVDTKRLQGVWGSQLFSLNPQTVFFVNNWSASKRNCHHLFRMDLQNDKVYDYLPFEQIDLDNNRGWGLDQHSTYFGDTALICIGTIDTLYSVTNDGNVNPRYAINITKNKMPDELRLGEGLTALTTAHKENYSMGVKGLCETSRYLILNIGGNSFFYDKKEKEIKAASTFLNSKIYPFFSFGGSIFSTGSDYIITAMSGLSSFNNMEYIKTDHYKNRNYTGNMRFKETYINAIKNVTDEGENPIVFLIKLNQ